MLEHFRGISASWDVIDISRHIRTYIGSKKALQITMRWPHWHLVSEWVATFVNRAEAATADGHSARSPSCYKLTKCNKSVYKLQCLFYVTESRDNQTDICQRDTNKRCPYLLAENGQLRDSTVSSGIIRIWCEGGTKFHKNVIYTMMQNTVNFQRQPHRVAVRLCAALK